MELKLLEDFSAVASSRSFSAAARARHVTQPALSRRVRALEDWYGQTLFDRSTYPVVLTDAGSAFLPVAEQVIADLYRSRRAARARGRADGVVRFAMPHSLAAGFFPRWWREQGTADSIIPSVVAADLDECIAILLSGACRFLMRYDHPSAAAHLDGCGIRSTPIGEDRLIPVHAPSLAWIGAAPAQGDPAVPLLGYHSGSFFGRVTSGLVAALERTRRVRIVYQSALVESLRAETLLGGGLAWLPARLVAEDIAGGRLQVLAEDTLATSMTILLCQPEGADPAEMAFGDGTLSRMAGRPHVPAPSR